MPEPSFDKSKVMSSRTYGGSKSDRAAQLFDAIYSQPCESTSKSGNSAVISSSDKNLSRENSVRGFDKEFTDDNRPVTTVDKVDSLQDSQSTDDVGANSQSSTCSLTNKLNLTSLWDNPVGESTLADSHKTERKRSVNKSFPDEEHVGIDIMKKDLDTNEKDCGITDYGCYFPQVKRKCSAACDIDGKNAKKNEADSSEDTISKKKRGSRIIYRHKWISDEEESQEYSQTKENEKKLTNENEILNESEVMTKAKVLKIVRNVKDAHECLESGERNDFENDIEYALSTLSDTTSTSSSKCLSILSLAKKCTSNEFRAFFRSQDYFKKVIKALGDISSSLNIAICAASMIYLMARDSVSVEVDMDSLRLFSNLLKIESPKDNEEYNRFATMAYDLMDEWLKKTFSEPHKNVQFDITMTNISPSFLMLESLVYLCMRRLNNQLLKNELLNMGVLQWVVSKIDKIVLKLMLDNSNHIDTDDVVHHLKILERCLRILESVTVCNPKNQAYLISHRGNSLISSSFKLMSVCYENIEAAGDAENALARQSSTCLNRFAGLLINLSHENELCSLKLGQTSSFLSLCVSIVTCLIPKFFIKEKQFDLIVLMCSLLVNLVERCNSNRRKLIQMVVPVYLNESGTVENQPALKVFTNLFMHHESVAKTIDEELDKDLILEDVPGEVESDDDSEEDSGRLNRLPFELTEDEMIETVQKAMNKASSHMEDSVLASYFALLIGCLLQQNEECVSVIKAEMPEQKLGPMVDQLQRFLEFIKITKGRMSDEQFVGHIIDLLDTLSS